MNLMGTISLFTLLFIIIILGIIQLQKVIMHVLHYKYPFFTLSVALAALKRKKRYEKQLQQIDGTLSTIEFQREALENASTNTEVLNVMGAAAKALKVAHGKMYVKDFLNTLLLSTLFWKINNMTRPQFQDVLSHKRYVLTQCCSHNSSHTHHGSLHPHFKMQVTNTTQVGT